MISHRAVLLVLVAASSVATPSHAAVRQCVENVRVTFVPPLTMVSTTGTTTWDYARTCTNGVQFSTVTYTYTGTCTFAVFGGNASFSWLFGGSLHVGGNAGNGNNRETVLVPNQVCNESFATGTSNLIETTA